MNEKWEDIDKFQINFYKFLTANQINDITIEILKSE